MAVIRRFTYDGFTVRVASDDPTHLAWLEEFLSPAFSVADDGVADCEVRLRVDDGAYLETLHRGPHASRDSLNCFALDNGMTRLPLWATPHAERLLFDESSRVFYAQHDGAPFQVLVCAGNRAARMALLRVVRELAMTAVRARHRLVLHGAAVLRRHRGLIIAGPKRAGKTSLLIHLLQQSGTHYVSNDRVVVDLHAPTPTLRGMPTLVTVRPSTLDLFPPLAGHLLERPYDHRYCLREAPPPGTQASAVRSDEQPLNLTPAQFCALMANAPRNGGPLKALLFPHVSDACTGFEIRALSPATAAERLDGARFGMGSGYATSEVFALNTHRAHIDAADDTTACAALAARIPSFDCTIGRDAYRVPLPIDDLVGRAALPTQPPEA
jgi:hypothetical protein